jgi:DNA-directed RNA polymerase subunit RPC12/RpoP
MAKYYTECAKCGKEVMVELFGKVKDREWKLENVDYYCDECKAEWKKEQAAKAATESQDLPALQGSEKQVVWALKIRLERIKYIEENIKQNEECSKVIPGMKVIENKYRKMLETFKTTTSAKWIIEHRTGGVENE